MKNNILLEATSKALMVVTTICLALIPVCLIVFHFQPAFVHLQPLMLLYINTDVNPSLFVRVLISGIFVGVMKWLLPLIASRLRNLLNSIPGPRFAKLTNLWKIIHCYQGTYSKRLQELHDEHGAIVQVGPYEYSLGNSQLLLRCGKLKKVDSPYLSLFHSLQQQTSKALGEALNMANIFYYEPNIDQCNSVFLNILYDNAQSGEKVKMADLVARYGYDVLFSTTVGESPGFLQGSNVSKLKNAMENWKFYAILHGSYLRFHPMLVRILGLFGFNKSLTSPISDHLNISPDNDTHCVYKEMRKDSSNQPFQSNDILEACIALMISGSDPAITHILASIFFAYQHTSDHIEALRNEIGKAGLSQPPKFKELIHAKPRMPLLYAVLQESLRLCETGSESPTYVSPKGGVTILDRHVPEGVSLDLHPMIRVHDVFIPSHAHELG